MYSFPLFCMVLTTGLYHGLVLKCILCHLWVENFHRCTKLFMVLLTGSYQNILAHITHVAGIHMHMYLQPLGALRHDYCYCTETFIQHISCAICMNPICQAFIKLIWFMMSYFGHANICLAGEEKYVTKNIANPGRLLHTSRISTVITANPRTNSKGIQKLRAVCTGDKRVCLTLILKLSHFQKPIMSVLSNLHP